jgi:hypothetical protein
VVWGCPRRTSWFSERRVQIMVNDLFDLGAKILEPISKKKIRVQGKARDGEKAEHTRSM